MEGCKFTHPPPPFLSDVYSMWEGRPTTKGKDVVGVEATLILDKRVSVDGLIYYSKSIRYHENTDTLHSTFMKCPSFYRLHSV